MIAYSELIKVIQLIKMIIGTVVSTVPCHHHDAGKFLIEKEEEERKNNLRKLSLSKRHPAALVFIRR
jgi:hypothetical protein